MVRDFEFQCNNQSNFTLSEAPRAGLEPATTTSLSTRRVNGSEQFPEEIVVNSVALYLLSYLGYKYNSMNEIFKPNL